MATEKYCSHTLDWTGYISNQPDAPPVDLARPLASRLVCGRKACRDRITADVEKLTGETAHYRDFKAATP